MYLLILSLLLTSCSVNKPITQYMKNEIKNEQPEKVFIFKEKIWNDFVLKCIKNNNENNTNTRTKKINYNEYLYIYKNYKNDTLIRNWRFEDFNINDVKLIVNNLKELKKSDEYFTGKRTINTHIPVGIQCN